MSSIKQKVKDYWNETPCGTGNVEYPEGTLEYYDALARERRKREFNINGFAEFGKWSGKRVLEVGCGTGTDLVEFAQKSALVTGVDMSAKSVELARKRFDIYGLEGEIMVADAEGLPFEDNTYDLVYSWGVIHHTPNDGKAVNEIYRVLKPDGELRAMIYHKPSVVCLQMWIMFGLLRGSPFIGIDDLFYRNHESIGTRVYTNVETILLFARFRNLKIKNVVSVYDIRYARDKYLPNFMAKLVPSGLGFNLLVKGNK